MTFLVPISTRPGLFAKVDQDVYDVVSKWKWHISRGGYAERSRWIGRRPARIKRKIRLHRFIMGDPPAGLVTDHINRDKLDNRRANLRFITQSENILNQDFSRSSRGLGFQGVRLRNSKWSAQISVHSKIKFLGTFATQMLASEAYWKAFEERAQLYARGN